MSRLEILQLYMVTLYHNIDLHKYIDKYKCTNKYKCKYTKIYTDKYHIVYKYVYIYIYIYEYVCEKMVFAPYDVFVFPVSNWNRKHMIWVRFTLMGMSKSFPKTMVWKNHLNMAIFGVCMLNHILGGMDSEEPDGKEFRDMPLLF